MSEQEIFAERLRSLGNSSSAIAQSLYDLKIRGKRYAFFQDWNGSPIDLYLSNISSGWTFSRMLNISSGWTFSRIMFNIECVIDTHKTTAIYLNHPIIDFECDFNNFEYPFLDIDC